jgi:predicted Kef-type K+ transport protein
MQAGLYIAPLSHGVLTFFLSFGTFAGKETRPALVLHVPIFLLALLVIRGLPAILYRLRIGTRRVIVAGLLQATSLSFIVTATQIGMELSLLSRANGAALIAAGVLSVVLFPLLALTVLRVQTTAQKATIK